MKLKAVHRNYVTEKQTRDRTKKNNVREMRDTNISMRIPGGEEKGEQVMKQKKYSKK